MNDLNEYLMEIAHESMDGIVPWNQPNPSTFIWIKNTDDIYYQVTIQKAVKARIKRLGEPRDIKNESVTYMFQVLDRKTKQTVISLSTSERPELFSALETIYQSAETGMDVRSANVLRKLLKK